MPPRLSAGLDRHTPAFIGPGTVIVEPGQNIAGERRQSPTATYGVYFADSLQSHDRLTATAVGPLQRRLRRFRPISTAATSAARTASRISIPRPASPTGRALADGLWRLCHGQPRADPGRAVSCASPAELLQPGQLLRRRPRSASQVVAQTFEAGLRGSLQWGKEAELRYSLGFFRTDLDDDIAMVNSPTRAAPSSPTSARRGARASRRTCSTATSAGASRSTTPWSTRPSSRGSSESLEPNPAADANGNITVQPGNHLPGIPLHQFKASAYYNVTDKWTVGATPARREWPVSLRRRSESRRRRCRATPPLGASTSYKRAAQSRALRLGPEHHQYAVFHLRYFFPDRVSSACPGTRCRKSAQLQPGPPRSLSMAACG